MKKNRNCKENTFQIDNKIILQKFIIELNKPFFQKCKQTKKNQQINQGKNHFQQQY